MTISLPAAAPSMPASKVSAGSNPMLGMATPSDIKLERFAQLLLQLPAQLTPLAADADGAQQTVAQVPAAATEQESGETAAADSELPGMTAPLLVAFLGLPQPASQLAATGASGAAPLATAALDAVRAAKTPSAPAPSAIPSVALPSSQLGNEANAGLPSSAAAAAAEIAPQPSMARASMPIIADAPVQLNERHAVSTAPALIWSSPIVNAGDNALPSVRLNGTASQWQQPLRHALGEQLQLQVARGSEQAVIRLSPPMLGHIDISIRHEAGVLQVHMSASNNEVLRQLQGIGDSLRQDLSQRQYNDVSVVVAAQTRHNDGDGRQRQGGEQREQRPGQALAEADLGSSAFVLPTDSE